MSTIVPTKANPVVTALLNMTDNDNIPPLLYSFSSIYSYFSLLFNFVIKAYYGTKIPTAPNGDIALKLHATTSN